MKEFKPASPLEWIRPLDNVRNEAEKIVLWEMIYIMMLGWETALIFVFLHRYKCLEFLVTLCKLHLLMQLAEKFNQNIC